MPLLGKKVFAKYEMHDIDPNEDVFYCKITNEAFRHYDAYYERIILCNSLIWTCAFTGKPQLTYSEAIQSEKKALGLLKSFPKPLKRPVLYIADLLKSSRLSDINDEVFKILKNHFFLGEEVEFQINNARFKGKVEAVKQDTPSNASDSSSSNANAESSKTTYSVKEEKSGNSHNLSGSQLSRPKGLFTKDKNKIFIKNNVENSGGQWKVKPEVSNKLKLGDSEFKRVMEKVTPPSIFQKKSSKVSQTTETKKETKVNGHAKEDDFKLTAEEKAVIKEKRKQKQEEKKLKKKEEQAKEREKKKVEQQILNKNKAEMNKPREDLECDDLKDLPIATPIDCSIPQEQFGDFMCVLEFLYHFGHLISLKDSIPGGINIDHLEKALTEKDIQGSFYNILEVLLSSLIQCREKEGSYEYKMEPSTYEKRTDDLGKAIHEATAASRIPITNHGFSLAKMPLDSFTISEMLRLHLLCSGSALQPNAQDDPALYLRMETSNSILAQLEATSIFELPIDGKLKILKLLTDQLLITELVKDAVEENLVNLKKLEVELRQIRWNFTKNERQIAASKTKKKVEGEGAGEDKKSQPEVEVVKETPEEKEKSIRDKAKRKEEFARKEKDMKLKINKLKGASNLVQLGRDRAYRRFYIFASLPGLFVENDDSYVGECLSHPTPKSSVQNEPQSSIMKKFLQAGKENELSDNLQSAIKQCRPNKAAAVLNPKLNSNVEDSIENDFAIIKEFVTTQEDIKKHNFVCTADQSTCLVHNPSLPRIRWSFYHQDSELVQLFSCLNPRGTREIHLKKQLEQRVDLDLLKDCPGQKLNKLLQISMPTIEVKKMSLRNKSLQPSEFADMAPREALECTLCDVILELEERIYHGSLGHVATKDREEWREIIQSQKYAQGINSNKDPTLLDSVTFLSDSLDQIAKGVESKFLRAPLGETEETKRQKQRYSSDFARYNDNPDKANLQPPKMPIYPFTRWTNSLASCSTLSQLFVHLSTLERSIAWDRSLLNVSCKLCRRKGDPETMLLCDGCDRGFHMGCLKPPLTSVPEGDWFCATCRPKEMPASPRKRKILEDEDEIDIDGDLEEEEEEEDEEEEESEEEDEDDNNDMCDFCSKGGTLICCDQCPLSFHLECIQPPLKRVPRGTWNCPKCVTKSSRSEGKRRTATPVSERSQPPAKRSRTEPKALDSSINKRKLGTDTTFNYVACEEMIVELFKDENSWPFKRAVTKRDAPDYFDIISNPMDLGTARHKLRSMEYKSNSEFLYDVHLTLDNCESYNPKNSEEYKIGARLRKKVEELEISLKLKQNVGPPPKKKRSY